MNFEGMLLVHNLLSSGMTELIPMVKMESRHPVEGPFGDEFLSIYIVREL